MSTNVVVLSGRIGKTPEIRSTNTGKSVTSFSLAVDRGYGDRKKTVWVNVETWDKTAEAVSRLTAVGKRITVVGELDEDTWNDSKTGEKKFRTKVLANRIDIIDFVERENQEPVAVGEDDLPFNMVNLNGDLYILDYEKTLVSVTSGGICQIGFPIRNKILDLDLESIYLEQKNGLLYVGDKRRRYEFSPTISCWKEILHPKE